MAGITDATDIDEFIEEWKGKFAPLDMDAWTDIFNKVYLALLTKANAEYAAGRITAQQSAQYSMGVIQAALNGANMLYMQWRAQESQITSAAINDYYTDAKRVVMEQAREDNMLLKAFEGQSNFVGFAYTGDSTPSVDDLTRTRILLRKILISAGVNIADKDWPTAGEG